ncbi:MAG: 50S ribosomal protein L16 [Promethearchaeota archaeon]
MARRPWHCYAKWNSKWVYRNKRSHKKDLVRAKPDRKVRMFDMGSKKRPLESWDLVLGLKVTKRVQISAHCLEAIRISLGGRLRKKVGRENFHFRIRVKPWHIYRENKMMAFAGADRLQTGMRKSFGKAAGVCARVRGGQIILELRIMERHLEYAKESLKVAGYKVCCPCKVVLLSAKDEATAKRVGLPLHAVAA